MTELSASPCIVDWFVLDLSVLRGVRKAQLSGRQPQWKRMSASIAEDVSNIEPIDNSGLGKQVFHDVVVFLQEPLADQIPFANIVS